MSEKATFKASGSLKAFTYMKNECTEFQAVSEAIVKCKCLKTVVKFRQQSRDQKFICSLLVITVTFFTELYSQTTHKSVLIHYLLKTKSPFTYMCQKENLWLCDHVSAWSSACTAVNVSVYLLSKVAESPSGCSYEM